MVLHVPFCRLMGRMRDKRLYILQLYVQKVTGTISVEDLAYLERVLEEDEDMRSLCRQWEHQLTSPESMRQLNPEATNQGWQQLKNKYEERAPARIQAAKARKRTMVVKLTAGGIATAAAVLAIVWLSVPKTPGERPLVQRALTIQKTTDVSLVLPDGKVWELGDPNIPRQLQVGRFMLASNDGELTFYSVTGVNPKRQENASHLTTVDAGGAAITVKVPNSRQYKLKLPDGTTVSLNSASAIKVPLQYNESDRRVELEGEGYFEVAGNASKPFKVYSYQTEVQVLGTSFNVNSYHPRNVKTSLVSGAVRMVGGNANVLLKPGHEAIYNNNAFAVTTFEPDQVLGWMQGKSDFYDAPLLMIGETLERRYNVKVEYGNRPGMKDTRYTLLIEKNNKIEDVMKQFDEITGGELKCELKDGTLYFN